MFKKLINKVVGDPTQKYLDSLQPLIDGVAQKEDAFRQMSFEDMRAKTLDFRERLEAGETLDDLLVEAFALVREASVKTTGLRHYDVQIMGGILMHRGEVVEMRTGEGKTLVATLPLYLNALSGQGVHLVTVNEYLARRDGGWMGKIFNALGLTVGCIGPQNFSALYDPDYVNPGAELEDERLVHWRPCTRYEAYRADITYGISSEFGFDYLRDNMAKDSKLLAQRSHYFAVIDEVDNILIDEARTPLIISGPSGRTSTDYVRFAEYVRRLRPNTADEDDEPNGHYDIDEKSRSISLTEMGISEIESRIPEIDVEMGGSLYDPRYFHLTFYVDNALKAQYLYKRDQQYVVQGDRIVIVDDFTGRLMPGRRYSEGLHEAIEAKEKVQVRRENVTVATITLQNYFRLYGKLAGMTGTAVTDAEEFHNIYELEVTPLPTNVEYIVSNGSEGLIEKRIKHDGAEEIIYVRPDNEDQRVYSKRLDYADRIYGSTEAKDEAIIDEVVRVRETGRPILVGTTSVEHSETIHRMLERRKVDHAVLNAKIHQSEAMVVAQAGQKSAVTISTNMAGRGTDILLGGNPEGLAAEMVAKRLINADELTRLATELIMNGPKSAKKYASSKIKKPSRGVVESLVELRDELDTAQAKIEELGVVGFVSRALQEPGVFDYNDAQRVIRLVRQGQFWEAREFLDEMELDTGLADEAGRQWDLHNGYQAVKSEPRKAAAFLADTLFATLYNGRAALIRAMMSDDLETAQELTQKIPGLPDKMIDGIQSIRHRTARERDEIWQIGGLHVIGSERHESRRIDNQLRGRAARQGDPGSSRFFLSVQDDLMLRFGGERLKGFLARTRMPEDVPIESSMLDRIIESSQERLEGYNFDIRKNVVEYDDVMSKQREAIYGERRAILLSEDVDLDAKVDDAFESAVEEFVQNYIVDYPGYVRSEVERIIHTFSTDATDYINLNAVILRLRGLLPGIMTMNREDLATLSADELADELVALAHENLEDGQNLYQLLQAAGRTIPLLPQVPNLGESMKRRKSGHLKLREFIRQQFIDQVRDLYDNFLSERVEVSDRARIWEKAESELNAAFDKFPAESTSQKEFERRQPIFADSVGGTLRDLLVESLAALDGERMTEALIERVRQERERYRDQIGKEELDNFQRLLLLDANDREWQDYLIAMDDLRREVGLEAFAQKDPKVEYKRRSYQMFSQMRQNVNEAVAADYFTRIGSHNEYVARVQRDADERARYFEMGYQAVRKGKGYIKKRETPKIGRNDPCPCGSGKKYKQCHLRADRSASARTGNRSRSKARQKKRA